MEKTLEEIIAEEEKKPEPASEPVKTEAQVQKDEEVVRKEEQLANLNRAIAEANDELRKKRKEAKLKPEEEDDLPKINEEDPSVRAWDKRIGEKVSPLSSESEKEKEEIRTFALREFLADKPALAKNPEKVKELVAEYEALSRGKISEKTKEGVMLYLDKAYASVFHEQLVSAARQSRLEKAQEDILFSDIAVSRGATAYSKDKEALRPLSEEDKAILARWGQTPQEWQEDAKKYK